MTATTPVVHVSNGRRSTKQSKISSAMTNIQRSAVVKLTSYILIIRLQSCFELKEAKLEHPHQMVHFTRKMLNLLISIVQSNLAVILRRKNAFCSGSSHEG